MESKEILYLNLKYHSKTPLFIDRYSAFINSCTPEELGTKENMKTFVDFMWFILENRGSQNEPLEQTFGRLYNEFPALEQFIKYDVDKKNPKKRTKVRYKYNPDATPLTLEQAMDIDLEKLSEESIETFSKQLEKDLEESAEDGDLHIFSDIFEVYKRFSIDFKRENKLRNFENLREKAMQLAEENDKKTKEFSELLQMAGRYVSEPKEMYEEQDLIFLEKINNVADRLKNNKGITSVLKTELEQLLLIARINVHLGIYNNKEVSSEERLNHLEKAQDICFEQAESFAKKREAFMAVQYLDYFTQISHNFMKELGETKESIENARNKILEKFPKE